MINCEKWQHIFGRQGERHTFRCAWGCRKTIVFRQPLDRNHAFDRMLKKNRVLRTHFFFPCIKTEVHAPGFYEFAAQILFYTCCRTKHKIEIWLFWQAEAHLSVCLISFSADILFAGADGVPRTSATNILQHDRCHLCVDCTDQVLINIHALAQIKVFDRLSVKARDFFLCFAQVVSGVMRAVRA